MFSFPNKVNDTTGPHGKFGPASSMVQGWFISLVCFKDARKWTGSTFLWQESKSNWYAPYQMFEIEVFSPMWWSIVWNLTWQFRASWPAICDPDRCQLPSLNPLPADTLWRNVVYLNPIFIQLDILENTIWPLFNKQCFSAFKSMSIKANLH